MNLRSVNVKLSQFGEKGLWRVLIWRSMRAKKMSSVYMDDQVFESCFENAKISDP